jgi:hypothetical protein
MSEREMFRTRGEIGKLAILAYKRFHPNAGPSEIRDYFIQTQGITKTIQYYSKVLREGINKRKKEVYVDMVSNQGMLPMPLNEDYNEPQKKQKKQAIIHQGRESIRIPAQMLSIDSLTQKNLKELSDIVVSKEMASEEMAKAIYIIARVKAKLGLVLEKKLEDPAFFSTPEQAMMFVQVFAKAMS